ncbi:EscU/YscU/HrcU family type III secretion system export apparatus switch protein [Sinobaca sp. H24]|jgi:flagellar biosynthesis protein|uniref:EscU/YscU/HrcU family type III secretion system export apparatus switch protein n=1 Tax=Sinobaca sp. H24 TaxID=2923376 RepID=UPI002079FB32|nr:EscU/YscU/HrcU family type III secretion system export apparatus switch protein [Sinobaca sp. H24]
MNSREPETKKMAAALKYDPVLWQSPVLKAKGKGKTAEEIMALAEANGIPVQKDPMLVEMLAQLEVNQTIPEELYEVVAEVFSFLYRLDRQSYTK